MTLSAGVRLGPYEILAPLGAGGMGEVWRAKDTRVDRAVALKVLPEEFFESEERRKRFEREARLLASLNHPGIATLYSFEEIPSSSPSLPGTHILVMELLEGETLRERLRGGPLSVRKAVDVAVQMARALAAAHEKGIVHRDLKPENVIVTKDERVKILDFGLAKVSSRAEAVEDPTEAGTLSLLTEAGAVFGTVGYMSPEQVRGEPVDHRSDIFSFGTIVYEMICGRSPFRRSTSPETMTAILKEDAAPLLEAPSLAPVIARCLEKRQEKRFQSTEDLAFALESLANASGGRTGLQLASGPTAARRFSLPGAALAALALLLVGGAWALWRLSGPPPPLRFERLTSRRGTLWSARFAPDGHTVVFGAAWEGRPVELFETRIGSTDWRSLGSEPSNILAISRNGEMAIALRPRFIFTFNHPGTLARASLAGGVPRELLADVHSADWTPDGKELVVARDLKGICRLETPPGTAILESEDVLGEVRVSPDGRLIAYWEYSKGIARVVVVSNDGSGRRVLSDGWPLPSIGLAWSPSGREIWFTALRDSGRALFAVDLAGRLRLVARMPGAVTIFDIAVDGRVLMSHSVEGQGIVAHTPGAPGGRDISWSGHSFLGDLSPDGKTAVFNEGEGLYLRRTEGSVAAVRLGTGFAIGGPVALSPDGKWVAAAMAGPGGRVALVPTGAGETRELALEGFEDVESLGWAGDSKTVFFLAWRAGQGPRIYRQALAEPRPIALAAEIGSQRASGLVVSPDGQRLALMSDGALRLFSADGTALPAVSGDFAGHSLIGWASDGRALHSYRMADLPGRIYRIDIATGATKLLREMLPADPAGIWRIHPVRVTPDGNSYAYTYTRSVGDLYVFDGLK